MSDFDSMNDALSAASASSKASEPPADVVPITRKRQRVNLDVEALKDAINAYMQLRKVYIDPACGSLAQIDQRLLLPGEEKEFFTADWLYGEMDVAGVFVDHPGTTQDRFMVVLRQMYYEVRRRAILDVRQRMTDLTNPFGGNLERALRIADGLLKHYGAEEVRNDKKVRHYCAVMLVHWMWLVKRKIWGGFKEFDPLMLTFWSREEGSGKSAFVRELTKILGVFVENASFGIFSDKFALSPFKHYYALIFPEMRGVQESSIEALKDMLERDYFTDREMYSTASSKPMRRATCVNTSNAPPPHGIKIDGSGRRFMSIHLDERIKSKTEMDEWLRPLRTHVTEMWQAVEVDADSILNDYHKEIRAYQADLNRVENIVDEFLETRCIAIEPVPAAEGTSLKEFRDAYEQFITEIGYPRRGALTQKNVHQLLAARGVTVSRIPTATRYFVCSHRLVRSAIR